MTVGLCLGSVFVHLFRFSILYFVCFRLDYFVLVFFAFLVFDLVFSVLRQEIGREERLRIILYRVGRKIYLKVRVVVSELLSSYCCYDDDRRF